MESFLKARSTIKRNAKNRQSQSKLKNKFRLLLTGYERNDKNAIRKAIEDKQEESEFEFTNDETSDADISIVNGQRSCSESRAPHTTILETAENSHKPKLLSPQLVNRNNYEEDLEHCSVMANYDNSSSHNSDENDSSVEDLSCEKSNSDGCSDQFSMSIESDLSCIESDLSCIESDLSCMESELSLVESDQLSSRTNGMNSEQQTNSESNVSEISISDLNLDNISIDSMSSLNVINNSLSSSAEFDNDGRLASMILNKLNTPGIQTQMEQSEMIPSAPSGSGYIQNKKKPHKKGKLPVLKGKKKKWLNGENMKPIYTIDASHKELPEFPFSFDNYNISARKNITQKSVNFTDLSFELPEFHHVQINHMFDKEPSTETIVDEIDNSRELPVSEISGALNEADSLENISIECVDEEMEHEPPSTQFHVVRNGVILIMSHPSTIYFHGKAKVKCMCGTVDVMGYTLNENFTEMYAPKFDFAQKISTKVKDCSHYGLFSKLTSLGLPVLKTEDIVITFKENDAILYWEQLKDQGLDFVENEFGGAEIFQMSKKSLSYEHNLEVALKLNCSLYTSTPYKPFQENPVWPEIVKHNKEIHSKGIVCGGKGTGKSTFLKYFINSRVSETPVVVIDLDPGQAEFTVAGNVSVTVISKPVIGPNFTHLLEPRRMLNVGLINVLDNLERYMSAVTEIIQYVSLTDEYANLPWIVNTMGMVNSIGLKLLTYIVSLLQPTFLVQMDSNVQNKCFKMLLNSQEIKKLYSEYEEGTMFDNITVPNDFNYRYFISSPLRHAPRENLTARDKRYLCYLAYFGKTLTKGVMNLLSMRPYGIDLGSIQIATNCKVEEDAITSVINGKIVALCENTTRMTGNIFSMGDSALVCLGFGLVRGVDLDTGNVYVTCVERSNALSRANTLLYCDCHPELTLSDACLAAGTPVPYRAPFTPHNRQLLDTPKRRFNPLQLLKLKRNQQKFE